MKDSKKSRCCICGGKIMPHGSWREGNNAEPVKKGRCCDDCNMTVVLRARLKEAKP